MMKKRLATLAAVGLAVILAAGMAGCGSNTASVADDTQTAAGVENTVKPEVATTPTREATDEFIGVEKAKELILADLGVTEATFVERETELDDMEYEFEVIVGDKEYDYEVHAVSGAIVEKDVDRMDAEDRAEAANKAADDKASVKPTSNAKEKISVDEAKKIILADLGVSAADFVEIDSERDDNEYEFEVIVGDYEYDYDVNFYTGKIVDKDVDRMDEEDKAEAAAKKAAAEKKAATDKTTVSNAANNAASEKISLDKAKEIALADLGISNAKLVESEYDDGEYELEFWADGVEYKYEINARTGKIVDKDVDRDDD